MYVFLVFLWYTISNWKTPKGFKGQHVNSSASSCAKSTAKDDQSCGVKTTWQKLADLQQSPTTEKAGISKYVYNIYIISPYIYVEYILCCLNFMFRMFKDFRVFFIYFSWKNGLNHPGYSTWENHLSSSWSSSGNRRDSDCFLTKSTLWLFDRHSSASDVTLPPQSDYPFVEFLEMYGNDTMTPSTICDESSLKFSMYLFLLRSNSWKLTKKQILRTQHGAQLLREGTGMVFLVFWRFRGSVFYLYA